MLKKELSIAVELARLAGKRILEIYEDGFDVEKKFITDTYSEPVTAADKASSRLIVDALEAEFPDDAVLSEEEPDDTNRRLASPRVWVIDPLDGTKGFTEGMGDFAVQIALVVDGRPSVGVVYQPTGDLLYSASTGGGTSVISRESEESAVTVSSKAMFNEMTVAVSRSHRSPRMSRVIDHFGFRDELSHGSVGLKIGFLTRRLADLYLHMSPYTKIWDTAAPQIILEEAGGRISDIFGGDLVYTSADTRNHNGILSTNGASHEKAVKHLRPLLTEFGRVRKD